MHEVRGLKFNVLGFDAHGLRRTSYEVRGLKYRVGLSYHDVCILSHLMRGARIEIFAGVAALVGHCSRASHEARGWKEINEWMASRRYLAFLSVA